MGNVETMTQKGLLRRGIEAADIVVRKAGDQDLLTFPASSTYPVDRWYGTEVLSHEAGAVNLTRAKSGAMPLLFNHDADDPIGMITGARVEQDRLMVDAALFGTPRAAEVRQMIEGGLRNVSLGYLINVVEENAKTEVFTVTNWEPYEVSIVTVPADPTVGIGRGVDTEFEVRRVRISTQAHSAATQEGLMDQRKSEEAAPVAVSVTQEERKITAADMEKSRIRAIDNLCQANKLDDKYREHWINAGLSIEQVSDDILRILEERGRTNPQPASKLGIPQREAQQFSLTRAILACRDNNWSQAGFELECSRAVAQKLNQVPNPNRFFVPFEVLERKHDMQLVDAARQGLGLARRDLTAASAGAGGYLVSTNNVGFIEILRNRSVAFQMGVRRLSGLTGNVTIPRQSVAATAYWLTNESTQITESTQTFVQVSLTPKNVGAYTEISRQLLLQSSPGVEGIVTDDLAQVVAVAADLAVLAGAGSGGEPLGILGTSGIGSNSGASIDYTKVLTPQEDVANNNVFPVAGGYVTTPTVAKLLMTKQRFTSTDTPLWQGNMWDANMVGFRAMSSKQMSASTMLFGDWQEAVVGEWGVLEVEVNPYANFQAGIVGVRAIYSMDVGVRRAFAFSKLTSIS